jgi:hypothetical protein
MFWGDIPSLSALLKKLIFSEMEINAENRDDYMTNYSNMINASHNTGALVNFASTNVSFQTGNPINEITTHGSNNFVVELCSNGNVVMESCKEFNLKNIHKNRLTANYPIQSSIYCYKYSSGGMKDSIVATIRDTGYSLYKSPWREITIQRDPDDVEGLEVDRKAQEHLASYNLWKYGSGKEISAKRWTISGVEIMFINKHNTGSLVIYNRSLTTVRLTTTSGFVSIPPYTKFNLEGKCVVCDK